MNLFIRLVPGLLRLLPFPGVHEFLGFIRTHFIQNKRQLDAHTLIVELSSIQEVLLTTEDLMSGLRKAQYVPMGIDVIPVQMIALTENDPQSSHWEIAPPGYLLSDSDIEASNKEKWIYGFNVFNVGRQLPLGEMYFPYRLLLKNGPYKNECFHCGLHSHDTTKCENLWIAHGEGKNILRDLATFSPTLWMEQIRHGSKEKSFLDGLHKILLELRYPFRPHFALEVFKTKNPDLMVDQQGQQGDTVDNVLKQIEKLMEARDLRGLRLFLDEKLRDSNRQDLHIFNGLLLLQDGDIDGALLSLQRTETFSKSNKFKAYSLLLQARIQLLWGGLEGAWASIIRASTILPNDPYLKYWHLVFAAITGHRPEYKGSLKALAHSPQWLTRLLCEPMLMGETTSVEGLFKERLTKIQEQVDEKLSTLKTLAEHGNKAFPQGKFEGFLVELRDMSGKVPSLGLMGLTTLYRDLLDLSTKIYAEINRNYNTLYRRLVSARKKLVYCMKKIPSTPKMARFEKRAMELHQEIKKALKDLRIIKKINELEGIEERVVGWEERVKRLLEDVDQEIMKEYHHELIKKYCRIGVAITLASWGLFYLYSILTDLFK